MSLTQKELQNLNTTILNGTPQEILTALNYLLIKPALTTELVDELMVIYVFNDSPTIRERAEILLSKFYSEGELQKKKGNFKIFEFVKENSLENDSHIVIPLYGNYGKVRSRYEPCFLKNDAYLAKYLAVAQKLTSYSELVEIAQIFLETAIEYRPDNSEAYILLGKVFQFTHADHATALDLYTQSLELTPQNFEAHLSIGYLKETHSKKYLEAIEHYQLACNLEPQNIRPYIHLANSHYYHTKDYQRCQQYIEIILSLNPNNETALTLLGGIYWKVDKNFKKALQTFELGLQNEAVATPHLFQSLAEFYVEGLDDFEKGRIFYQKALDKEADKNCFNKLKSLLIKRFDDYGTVKYYYEQMIVNHPLDTELLLEFSDFVLEYTHDFPRAKKLLQKVLKLSPNHQAAKTKLSQI